MDATWPMFRYDEERTGISPFEGPLNAILKWSYSLGPTDSFSPSIVWVNDGGSGYDKIYIGSLDNRLYALQSTDIFYWSYRTGGDVKSSPAFLGLDDGIYSGSDDSTFYALRSSGMFH